jgi:hypothetical protein
MFQITHQQAAKVNNAQSPRVILRTLLEHIGGPGGGYIEEVTRKEEEEEEEATHQLRAIDQLPGVGNAASTDGARDGPSVGNQPNSQETRARIDLQAQGWSEYNPNNASSYPVTYADGPDEMRVTRWTQMVQDNKDTWIEGTEGQGQRIYQRQLRS